MKKTNIGVVVLICILFVVSIGLSIWVLVNKLQENNTVTDDITTNVDNTIDDDITLTEEELNNLVEQSKPELQEKLSALISNESELTDSLIQEMKQVFMAVLVENAKTTKQIEGKLPSAMESQIKEFVDITIDYAIAMVKATPTVESLKESTISNIKSDLMFTWVASRSNDGTYVNSSGNIMTKADYIAILKEIGYTDEEINYVNFTVDEYGQPQFDK